MRGCVCFVVFVLLHSSFAQDVRMEDGCYYYNEEMLGCIKATVNDCDFNWVCFSSLIFMYVLIALLSYIIINPLGDSFETGKVLLSDGLVGIGERFASCFPMGMLWFI